MNHSFMTRRQAIALMVSSTAAGIGGCGAVGPVTQIILRLHWDKIISVVVNVVSGYVTVKGILGGKEVQYQEKLRTEQLKEINAGSKITVELKDGKQETVQPSIQ